jgi:hypothetical protein
MKARGVHHQNVTTIKTGTSHRHFPFTFNYLLLNHITSISYNDQEADIQKALIHHEIDPTLKFNKFVEIYKVPYKRLLKRHKGRSDRSNIGEHNKILSDDQKLFYVGSDMEVDSFGPIAKCKQCNCIRA